MGIFSSSTPHQPADTAYVIGPTINAKTAALFFSYVVPISCGAHREELYPPFMQHSSHNFHNRSWHWTMEDALLGALYEYGHKSIIEEEEDIITIDSTGHPVYGYYRPKEGCEDAIGFALLDMLQENALVHKPGAAAMGSVVDKSKKVSIRDVIFGFNAEPIEHPIYGCDLLGRTDEKVNAVLITLSNVPWIDLSRTAWEQILEFRRDEESLRKFRNFRVFLSNSYVNKDKTYIEDDFLKRLDDFERMRKKHGFDLQNSTIKAVLKSKYIVAGGLSGLLAWLFGTADSSGIIGSAALLGGVSVEVADTLLNIRAANFDLNHQVNGHELAYAIAAREVLTHA